MHSVTKELWYLEEVLPISLFCRFHHARVFKSCSIKDHVCKVVEIHCFDTEKSPIRLRMVNGKIMVPWKLSDSGKENNLLVMLLHGDEVTDVSVCCP